MNSKYFYSFPALKGIQASREYFVIMCPLAIVSKLFIFNEDELPAEFRSQRIINRKRIPEMANYIVTNQQDYVFSSLTASIDGTFEFTPTAISIDDKIGLLKVSMDSHLLINDGQHRRAAIEEALKSSPELGEESISIVLYIDEGLTRSQQIFADLNKHAVNVSKSIGILYDSRDPIAIYTKELLSSNKQLDYFTDKENPSLSKYSTKLFTLSCINDTNKNLMNKLDASSPKVQTFASEFWDVLCLNMIEWKQVFNKKVSANEFRSTFISSNGVVLESLGFLANSLYIEGADWKTILSNVDKIDWHRANTYDWLYRAMDSNGRMAKNYTYIRLTINMIKMKLGLILNLDDNEFEKKLVR